MIVAYEGFSPTSVDANGFEFYGIRNFRYLPKPSGDRNASALVEVECGYATPGMPLDGIVTVTFPSRDAVGNTGILYLTAQVNSWSMRLDGISKSGLLFIYSGHVDTRADNRLEFEPTDQPGARIKVVDL